MHISGKEGEVIKTQQFNSRSQPAGQPAARSPLITRLQSNAEQRWNNCVIHSRANKAILRSAREFARVLVLLSSSLNRERAVNQVDDIGREGRGSERKRI